MGRLAVCIVAVLLLTAGCLSDPGVGVPGGEDPVRQPGVGPVQGEPEGSGSLPSDNNGSDERALSDESLNPWDAEDVVVAVDTGSSADRDYVQAVSNAVAYWNRNANRYGQYAPRFVVRPDAKDPDVVVRFGPTVVCNGETGWLGCAPVLNATDDTDSPTVVQINTRYDDDTINRTVKHEFGHLLGIRHGEEPMPLMEPAQKTQALTQPNVTERENPWQDDRIEVYVDYGDMSRQRRAATRSQIGYALTYYDEGAEGSVSENVTFVETDAPGEAEIYILFMDDPWCRNGAGSCGDTVGVDADGDESVEYHTETRIAISNVQTDAVGWHVGYWIGDAMGASSRSELPPAFRRGANRTGEWWETD